MIRERHDFFGSMNQGRWIELAIVLFCFFVPLGAWGASGLTTEFGPGWPIEENNLVPGQTIKRIFSISSSRPETMVLSLDLSKTFSNSLTDSLDKKLIVQIKRPDGSFAQFPNGNSFQSLEGLITYTGPQGQKDFPFDTITGKTESPLPYEFWVTLDSTSGNEYQSKQIAFSLSARVAANVESKKDDRNQDNNDNKNNGPLEKIVIPRVINPGTPPNGTLEELAESGEPTVGSGSSAIGETGDVQGEETEGMVAGEQNCQTLPFLAWVFAVAVLGGLLIFSLSYRFKEEASLRWFLETIYMLLALMAWFILDICRIYDWFPIAVLLIGAVIYLSYLHEFNRKQRNLSFS